jgi:rhodanese-related sulfurtransferase
VLLMTGKYPKTMLVAALLLLISLPAVAQENPAVAQSLEEYLLSYDYDARREMKANSLFLIDHLLDDEVVLVDIRFAEEQQAWNFNFALHIPLNELPLRLDELPKDKLIVTACPHKDRAILAMAYLRTQGYQVRYLEDGLISLAEKLRGDDARMLMQFLPAEKLQ